MTNATTDTIGDEKFAGNIHLVRHGAPDISRAVWLSRQGFNTWWTRYDRVGLAPASTPPERLRDIADEAAVIVSSPTPRARETGERLAGGRSVVADELYGEMPLPAPLVLPFLHLTPPLWGTLSRFAWWLGYADGGETRYEAEERTRLATDRLIELAADSGGDVVMCGHGWFIHMAGKELRRRGWIAMKRGGATHWDHKSFGSPL